MKLIYGVTTYNRLEFLKDNLESWDRTRDKNHQWVLMIADDGSNDGTVEYIRSINFGCSLLFIQNPRGGINFQTNTILKSASQMDFDYGFMANDDIEFLKSGWDNAYIGAIQDSGYDHLCFFDEVWCPNKDHEIYGCHGSIRSVVLPEHSQGCFWTFTQKVLEKVGYFDPAFGFFGWGDTDYTVRCCRAGLNSPQAAFDISDSNTYLRHWKPNYYPSISDVDRYADNKGERLKEKKDLIRGRRNLFVPFDEETWPERDIK